MKMKNHHLASAAAFLVPIIVTSFVSPTTVTVSVVRRGKALRRVSALCKTEGPGWAYHNLTEQCYKVGTDGPCEALMVFTVNSTSPDYGHCDCDYKRQCGRPIVRWPPTGECYYVYEQGPCGDDEWVALAEDKTAVCSPNVCRAEEARSPSNMTNYWFSDGGRCYQTNTQGYCEHPNARLFFKSRDVRPSCNFGLLCGTANGMGLEELIKLWNLHREGNSSSPNAISQTYVADITDKTRMKEFVQRIRLVALDTHPPSTSTSTRRHNKTLSE